jgi:hypothetical protein
VGSFISGRINNRSLPPGHCAAEAQELGAVYDWSW